MPWLVLVGIFVAFWFDPPIDSDPLTSSDLHWRLGETLGWLSLVAIISAILGRSLALWAGRRRGPTPAIRRAYRGEDKAMLREVEQLMGRQAWPDE